MNRTTNTRGLNRVLASVTRWLAKPNPDASPSKSFAEGVCAGFAPHAMLMPFMLSIAALMAPATSVAALVDVQISEFTDNPDPGIRGGLITYTTVVKNGGPSVATGVVVTWPLPATTTFVSVNDGSGGGVCAHNGVIPGVVTCNYASVPADDLTPATSKTISLVIRTGFGTPSTIAPSVSVSQVGNTDTNTANDGLFQNTTIVEGADLGLSIVGFPDPVLGGQNITWAITGMNSGPDASGPVTVTVSIPGVLSYQSFSGGGWSCSGSSTLTCTRSSLASGSAFPTLSIVTRVTSIIASGTVTVGANISQSSIGDPVGTNNAATANVSVNPGLDLRVTQDVPSPSAASAGGSAMTFVIRPANLGPYPATAGMSVSIELPVGFGFSSISTSPGWTCTPSGSPIVFACSTSASVASGAVAPITLIATTPASVSSVTAYTLTATVSSNPGSPTDVNSSNDVASRNVSVTPAGLDISITKNKSPGLIAFGSPMMSTINVSSAAGGTTAVAGSIVVTDTLNPSIEGYVSFTGAGWSCSYASPVVTCTLGIGLSGGASAPTLRINTSTVAPGVATNSASVSYSGAPGDYNLSNNGPVTASTTITATPNSPDLAAGLSIFTPTGSAIRLEFNESTITFRSTLSNLPASPSAAENTRMLLTVGAPISGTTIGAITPVLTNNSGLSNATYTCSPVPGPLSGTLISCNQTAGTRLEPGDSVQFAVPVSRPLASGSYTARVDVDSTTQGDPNTANNFATAGYLVDPIADVAASSKSIITGNSARAGTNSTYVITSVNNGPSDAVAFTLADRFTVPAGDTGFMFISYTATSSGTCSGLNVGVIYGPGNHTLTCTWPANVPNGGIRTVNVTVRPNWQAGPANRSLVNVATVSTSTPESVSGSDNGNNSQSATLTVTPALVDVLANNSDTPDPVGFNPAAASLASSSTNNDFTYRVAITNNGPSMATGVGFTYVMSPPVGKSIVFRGDSTSAAAALITPSGTIPSGICNNAGSVVTGPATLTVTCTTFAPNNWMMPAAVTNRYLVFRALSAPAAGGDTFNTMATVFTNEDDSNSINNAEPETSTVRNRADLSITKTPSVPTVNINEPFNWIVTLSNAGPGNSTETTVNDTLPIDTSFHGPAPSFVTSYGDSGTCSVAGSAMSCAISTASGTPFVPGATATITIPVRVVTYPGGTGTTANCASAISSDVDPLSSNNLSVCANVSVVRSSLAGFVFNDANQNGIFDGGDSGIGGVAVAVSGQDAYGNALIRSINTSGTGAYILTDLPPAGAAGYQLRQTQPTTHVNGSVSPIAPTLTPAGAAGDDGTYVRGGTAGNSLQNAIRLGSNQAGTNFNFPELVRRTLSGFVYLDGNGNNVFGAAPDAAISGATVRLLDALGGVISSANTNVAGAFAFTLLDPFSTYGLEQVLPASPTGLSNGAVNPGLVNGLACVTGCTPVPAGNATGNDRITDISMLAGNGTSFNFGEVRLATVGGVVFVDADRDNTMSSADPDRVANVTIRLVTGANCASGTTVATTTSTASGTFLMDANVGQSYLLCQTQPAGYGIGSANTVSGSNSITLPPVPVGGLNNNLFGELGSSLSGSVYEDVDNDGVRDVGESPIVGIAVNLVGIDVEGNAVLKNTVTNASGNYSFLGLRAGNHQISEGAVPALYSDGMETVGSVGGSVLTNDVISSIALPTDTQATGYLFGERPVSGISGLVWIDLNRNSTIDPVPTDLRKLGVVVRVVQGTVCSGTVVASTTTDAAGAYAFPEVPTGSVYTVCATLPAGHASGSPLALTLPVLTGTGSSGNHFRLLLGSIESITFEDRNNNGTQNAGEPGISGVVMTLSGLNAEGATVSQTATTNSAGVALFDGLLAGTYTLSEGAVPPMFADGIDTAGSAGGSVAVNDVITGIALVAGNQATGYRFGERSVGSISGTVYVDRNRDGVFGEGSGDRRLGGVTVFLVQGTSCSSPAFASTTTAIDGSYAFRGVPTAVVYTLCEVQPVGHGSGDGSPDARTLPTLTAAGSAGNDFAETLGTISGRVFVDTNNDGVRNAGEIAIAGVSVALSGTDASGAAVNRTAITGSTGAYVFDDLLSSDASGYVLLEQPTQPVVALGGVSITTFNGKTTVGSTGGLAPSVDQVPSAIRGVALTGGGTSTGNDFAELIPSSISGRVFIDLNDDGIQAPGVDLPISGVRLTLTGSNDLGTAVSLSTLTDAAGAYRFDGLRPGIYTVTQPDQPAGTNNGKTVFGTTGGSVTNPSTTPSAISGIAVGSGGLESTANNFAELSFTGSISGQVFLDLNNDGTRQAGEPALSGVVIELDGQDTSGIRVTKTTSTALDGSFLFSGLPAGTYGLKERSQPVWNTVDGAPAAVPTLNGVTKAGTAGGVASTIQEASSIQSIVLGPPTNGASTATSSGNDFAEILGASITGRVYIDQNDNGLVDGPASGAFSETGIASVPVTLKGQTDAGEAVSLSAMTGADGTYTFANIRPGTYVVSEPSQPDGTQNGKTTAGSTGGTATDVNTTPSSVIGIAVQAGQTSSGNNFGERTGSADVRVTKSHTPAVFTVDNPGTVRIEVRNVGGLPTEGGFSVSDRLPTGIVLARTPAAAGWTCSGAAGDSAFSCQSTASIAPGAAAVSIEATVRVGTSAAEGAANAPSGSLDNAVMAEGALEGPGQKPTDVEIADFNGRPYALPICTSPASANACRDPIRVQLAASLEGTVWFDGGTRLRLLDPADRRLPNWVVELVDGSGAQVATARTGQDGTYRFTGLLPGVPLEIRFREPRTGVIYGTPVNGEQSAGSPAACDAPGALSSGGVSSCVQRFPNTVLAVLLSPGKNLSEQSLPVDPSGIVYDTSSRLPVPGSLVTLRPIDACVGYDPALHLVNANTGGYRMTGTSASVVVGEDGFYQFIFSSAAPSTCRFVLDLVPPASHRFVSTLIQPEEGTLAPTGGPTAFFLVQPQSEAPTGAAPSATPYWLDLRAGSGVANIIHNHIPVDPLEAAEIVLTKTGDKRDAEIGDTVKYTITVKQRAGSPLTQITVRDRIPQGFVYVEGTAAVDGIAIASPAGMPGRVLGFELDALAAGQQKTLTYRLRVGVGSQESDGLNTARAHGCGLPVQRAVPSTASSEPTCLDASLTPLAGSIDSNEGAHRVRVLGGVFTTQACVLGKVFVDCNGNSIQDTEELGIPGVRMVLNDGAYVVSDSEGKYSLCDLTPRSHVIRLDESTMPAGSRPTTSSNRNLGDAGSLWLDLKKGELHRADFIEGSCSAPVLEQVKARRAQGEIRGLTGSPQQAGRKGSGGPLKFRSKPAQPLSNLPNPSPGTSGMQEGARP